jgi:hypothetical protein
MSMFMFHSRQSTPNVRQGEPLVLWECSLCLNLESV